MVSCTWLKDDVDECPFGFWLKLHYTYNILDVEAAPKYLMDAYVYIYDADGNYVKRLYVTRDQLTANDYRVKIEDLPEGDYQFVVWSGMGSSLYSVAGETKTIGEFRLSLTGVGGSCASELPALYHGYLQKVHYDDSYAQHDVELMKNTNQLACLVVSTDNNTELKPENYTMKITADNGVMNAYNSIIPSGVTTYESYSVESVVLDDTENGKLNGIKFGLNTLRLMNDGNARIIIQKKQTPPKVLEISLPEYIGMVGTYYTNLGREIGVQEYMDRQDFYTIILYVNGDIDQLMQIQVNSWRVRVNNHLKL